MNDAWMFVLMRTLITKHSLKTAVTQRKREKTIQIRRHIKHGLIIQQGINQGSLLISSFSMHPDT